MSAAQVVLFVAGAGIPLMAALNAGLGTRFGNPIPAAFVLFLLALLVTAVLVLTHPLPSRADIAAIPIRFYLGGLFVAFYVLAMTQFAPTVGLGNAIFVVLCGQLVAASVIDHFAWLDVPKALVTTRRFIGITLMIIGVYLARKPTSDF